VSQIHTLSIIGF